MTRANLQKIPDVWKRIQAHEDFDRAIAARENARRELRYRLPGWRFTHRFELRAAIRAWRHYAKAVRSIA